MQPEETNNNVKQNTQIPVYFQLVPEKSVVRTIFCIPVGIFVFFFNSCIVEIIYYTCVVTELSETQ